jgi:hypothetical protein
MDRSSPRPDDALSLGRDVGKSIIHLKPKTLAGYESLLNCLKGTETSDPVLKQRVRTHG